MKRTFGRFMSLLLVFAMVLAMVPAVFAADTVVILKGTKYLAPYQTLEINYETERTNAGSPGTNRTYFTGNITRWTNSNRSLIDMTVDSGTQKVTLTHRGGTGRATITAYYKDTNQKEQTAATWTVTITDWTMKLSPSNPNSSSPYTLTTNDSVTLTATITGVNDWLKASDTKVRFTSSSTSIAKVNNQTDPVSQKPYVTNEETSTSTSTATASVTINAGTGNGTTAIIAELGKETVTGSGKKATTTWTPYTDTDGDPIRMEFWVKLGGSSEYTIKFSNDELSSDVAANRVMTVSYNTTNKKITPVLYKNGSPVNSRTDTITYTYTSSWEDLVHIDPDGTVLLQDSNQNRTGSALITVGAKLNGNVLTGTTAQCTVTVIKTAADGVSIDYKNLDTKLAMQNGKYVFAYKDDGRNTDVTFQNEDRIVTALDLSATVDSEDKTNDLTRVKWTTESPKVAKFQTSSGLVSEAYGENVTLVSTGSGPVKIKAELDGKSDSMSFTVWPAYEYDEIVTKPDIPTSISSREDAFNRFSEQYVTIRLTKTDEQVSRPMRNVQYTSSSKIQLEGWVDGFDKTNKIAYYPDPEKSGTDPEDKDRTDITLDHIISSAATMSDIIILNQPQDATYKLDETVGTLSIQATPRNGKQMTSFTWYDNNDKAIKVETVNNLTSTYTSTLKLSDFITSAGTYGFYCIVRGSDNSSVKSRTAIITIGGDYNIKITPSTTSVKPGDTVTLNAVAQQYNPVTKRYADVSGNYTVNWAITAGDTAAATLSSRTGSSVTLTAKSGGTITITAETTFNTKKFTGTQKLTITVPTADDVTVMLDDNATYVALDGTKISDAVKSAAKSAPSYISFTQPSNGVIYTTSAMSSKVTDGNRYSPSDVSKMVFKPTSNAASYTLEYKAYGSDGQIASGKVLVMTSAGSVVYHISANESQQMLVNDFQSKYGNGLSSVVFGTNSDNRGGLYKGSTTSSGKVGSESYTTTTLKNVYFIAGPTASKYTVTIPYTANGSNGTKYGNLIVYVNDTHSIYSTGASFRSMDIATEIAPENASSNAYATIDSVVGGKLYSAYSSIISNTPLKTSDLGSTKYYFNSSSTGIDSLYVLPIADKTTVDVNYTVYDGSTRTKGTVSFKVIQQTTSQKFTDVNGSTKWAANSVDFMADSKLVNGITTTTFGPNQTMTRAMLVTILYRAAGQPSVAGITNKFTDLKANEYYVDAVLWAANTGVVTGATATKFDPDGKVTREQIAAILYRYAGSPTGNAASLTGFSDQKNVSAYAVPALQWAVGLGIITGVSTNGRTTLSAKNNATRAQVAVMLHRFLTYDR